jgi:hypothetical protein
MNLKEESEARSIRRSPKFFSWSSVSDLEVDTLTYTLAKIISVPFCTAGRTHKSTGGSFALHSRVILSQSSKYQRQTKVIDRQQVNDIADMIGT